MSATLVLLLAGLWAGPADDDPPAEELTTKQADAAPGSIEDLYYKGAARYSASDYGTAIEHFTQALDLAGRQGTDPSVRAALLFNLGRAHTRAFDVDGDARHLRQAVDIHRRFLEEAELLGLEVPDQIAAAQQEIAEIQARLDALANEEDADDETSTEPSPPDAAPARPDTGSTRRVRGTALTVTGGVLLGAGVGVAVYGSTFRRDALDTVAGVDDPPEQEQAFVDAETRKGRTWIAVGAASAGVGAGLLVWGIVDLVAANKQRRTAATPWLGPGTAGLAVTGRF